MPPSFDAVRRDDGIACFACDGLLHSSFTLAAAPMKCAYASSMSYRLPASSFTCAIG
jgi:hypothetical protein